MIRVFIHSRTMSMIVDLNYRRDFGRVIRKSSTVSFWIELPKRDSDHFPVKIHPPIDARKRDLRRFLMLGAACCSGSYYEIRAQISYSFLLESFFLRLRTAES